MVIDLSAPAVSDPVIVSKLKDQSPDVRVLVLTFLKEERLIGHALRAGADGYVMNRWYGTFAGDGGAVAAPAAGG